MRGTHRSRRHAALLPVLSVVVLVTGILPGGAYAGQTAPSSTAPQRAPSAPSQDAPAGRAVERPPIELGIAPDGGAPAGLTPPLGDPSIALRPWVAGQVADVKDLWTAHSRTTQGPDGKYTLVATTQRSNFRDPEGVWQAIDLTLIPDRSDVFGLRTTANDRTAQFGTVDASKALAGITSPIGAISLRVLDFPSTRTTTDVTPPKTDDPSTPDTPAPEPNPTPTATPSPSPLPSPIASTVPAPSPSPSILVGPDAEPTPSPSPSPSPDPSASPPPSAAPTASASPSPTPEQPADPGVAGAAVPQDGVIRFTKDAGAGEAFTLATEDGFRFGVTLSRPDQLGIYAFALDVGRLTATLAEDGQTILLWSEDASDEAFHSMLVGAIGAPTMLDANEVPADPKAVTVGLYVPGTDATPPAGVSPEALASLGQSEVVVSYAIDPAWLVDPLRAYPVTLDPDACLGDGASGCAINSTAYNIDHFIMSGLPTQYPTGWTTFRVGYDSRSDDGAAYGTMRGLVYFEDVTLPDGAVVYDTDLKLHISSEYGGPTGQSMTAYRVSDKYPWSILETWNDFNAGLGYDTGGPSASDTVPASGNMQFDVDGIVQSWYTRRGKDWKPDLGFLVRMDTVSTGVGEVEFDRYSDATAANRPLLTITYETPKVSIDFDPGLGTNYAPSTMVAGQATTLPIRVSNNSSGFDFTTANWKIGYRWFDAKGALVSSSYSALPSCVGTGGGCVATTSTFGLPVTPPAVVGQYTLRLDIVRAGTVYAWASDYATPSLYYSRNKKSLSPDNTRWTGSSGIERDEYGIAVVAGGGGDTQSVATGDGGSLAFDLWSRNLTYAGAGGVGFDDLIPLSVGYGYDSKYTTDCGGILAACGWSTTFDERFIPGSTGDTYTYVGPSGTRYLVGADGDQQLTSGAPVLLQRPRTTLFDETVPTNSPTASLVTPSFGAAFSGQYAVGVAAGTVPGVAVSGAPTTNLNTYRYARFAIATSGAANAALAFKIHNNTTGVDRWFMYSVGPTNWDPGFDYVYVSGTVANAWKYVDRNLYQDVRSTGNFGGTYDDYQVTAVQVQNKTSGAAGSVYVDALRLEAGWTVMADGDAVTPTWSSGGGLVSTVTGDVALGTNALRVNVASIAASPDCNTSGTPCWLPSAGGLWAYGFVHWQWKKVGGQAAAIVFHLRDERTNATGDITYYAGPTAPPGAVNPLQVSDATPTGWSTVTRNLLEDARQVLNFYNDAAGGASPAAPPTQGPTPDDTRLIGYKVSAVDGNFLLLDDLVYSSLPDYGADEAGHPNTSGDTTRTYDFTATYRDGSVHAFNEAGLLERIIDRNGNRVELDWSRPSLTTVGPAGYQLDVVHAATDATTSGAWTYDRELRLTYAGTSPRSVTIAERLGTTGTPITGRSTAFTIATATSTGVGIGDVIAINPARTEATCAASGTPSGCDLFTYTDSTNHRLEYVADPRWNQTATTVPDDRRFQVTWSGSSPLAVMDRSVGGAGGTPILRVLDYAVAGVGLPAATRVAWQDAAGLGTNFARYTDITSDGRTLIEYIPLTCQSANCVSLPSTGSLANQKASETQFDGLARESKSIEYRCPGVTVSGCTGATYQAVVSRQGTKAGAKVDNYNDPLTAGEVGWTQSADQYVASLRDGSDEDLYRTFYQYDENGQQTTAAQPVYNARPDYSAAVRNTLQTTTNLKGYWRLGEPSGTTAADLASTPHNGTYTNGVTLNATSALINDADPSATFDGVNDYVAIPSLGTVSGSFTAEAWVKPSSATSISAFLGSRTSNTAGTDWTFDAKLYYDSTAKIRNIQVNIGNGTAWLLGVSVPFDYQAGRWYHIGVVVDDAADQVRLYANGQAVATVPFATAGTPLLTDAARLLRIGSNGRTSLSPQWFAGSIDDVAIYTQTLTPSQIFNHYQAGRSVAIQTSSTLRDRSWRPIQVDDEFLASSGFESGLVDWEFTNGSVYTATTTPAGDPLLHQPTDPTLPASWASFKTGLSGGARQDVQLVPGQTFRFQVWHLRTGTTVAAIDVSYWSRSTGSWVFLAGGSSYTDTVWTGRAWDLTLPFDTDGRVRVTLSGSGGSGANSAYFDDAALVTTYGRTTYTATSAGDPFNGLVRDTITFSPTQQGPVAEFLGRTAYAASALAPAIFPTTTTSNYENGTFVASTPDQDVSVVRTVDAWGHELTSTDQDGVATTTVFVASGQPGYATDVVSSTNAMSETTAFEYDLVGNQTKVTTPGGAVTETTYDLRNHAIRVKSPIGLYTKDLYDVYGMRTGSVQNQVNDVPSAPTALDDLVTSYTYDAYGAVTETTGNTGTTGDVGSRVKTDHDLLGNTTATTVMSTYNGTAFGGGRLTTQTVEVVSGASRATLSATRGPGAFAATGASAPLCPDGSGAYCNTVDRLDQSGQSVSTTDATGMVTRTLRDLAGKPVFTIANYGDGVYSAGSPAVDLISTVQNDLFGRPTVAVDVLGRKTITSYDALGRTTQVRNYDSGGMATLDTRTRYTGAGRVDRVSLPGANGAADSALTWTKTIYDLAGRATKTLAHYDTGLAAGLSIESFETRIDDKTINNDETAERWAASGFIAAVGGTITRDTAGASTRSGAGRLAITTVATANTGAEWTLDGTFVAGHVYKARVWVNPASTVVINAKLGASGDLSTAGSVTGDGTWKALDVTWTPSTDQPTVHLGIYRPSATASTFYADDAMVWDSTSGKTDWNIPTETAYDLDGRVVASILTPGTVGTAEATMVTRTTYDALGRTTNIRVNEIAGGSGSDVNLDTASHYDDLGRNDTTTDPTGTVTRYDYDRLGRLTATFQNYLDGNASSANADDDVQSQFAYNAAGELIGYCSAKQVQLGGCAAGTSSNAQAWHYAYDDAGRMARQTPPVNATLTVLATTLWEYDKAGRLAKACDGPSTITDCTSAGVLRTSVLTPDAVGRTIRADTYTGPMTTLSARTDTVYLGDGQPSQTKYSTGTTPTVVDTIDYQYDTSGRQTKQLRSGTVLAERSYGADGTLAWRKDGDAAAIGQSSFSYDWAQRLTGVDLPDATFSTAAPTFGWRLDGLIGSRTWSGSTATFAYDGAKRLTSLTKGALTLSQAYNADGYVTSESRSLTGVTGDPGTGTQSFSYDALGRVTGSTGLASGNRAYTYDRDSNRLTKSEGGIAFTYTYDRTDELMTVIKTGGTTQNFTYDAYGNQTGDAQTAAAVTTMGYDLTGHLTAIDAAGTANDATFTLDAMGRFRTRVLVTGGTDTYSYIDTSEVVTRIANSGGTTTDSIVSPTGDRLGVKVGATLNWFLPDLHGDIAASLDSTEATVVNAIRYDAYGQTIATGTAGGTRVGADTWKYQGRLDVSPSGLGTPLYDMSARFYNPSIGAFTQFDSVMGQAQNPLSMHRFLYAGANPATLIDPTGHWFGIDDALAVGIGAVVGGGLALAGDLAAGEGVKLDHIVAGAVGGAAAGATLIYTGNPWLAGAAGGAATEVTQQIWDYAATGGQSGIHLDRVAEAGATGFVLGGLTDKAAKLAGKVLAPIARKLGDEFSSVFGRLTGSERPGLPERGPGFSCANSFSPDTLVATPTGGRAIAGLAVSDTVLAEDPDSGVISRRTISAVMVNDDPATGTVVIDGEAIETTPEHPFYTVEHGWVEAKDLVIGDHVPSAHGTTGEVLSVDWTGGRRVMYNLTVEVDHTYFVGGGRWLVHNACGPRVQRDPNEIRFSQDNVGRNFGNGRSVESLAEDLRTGRQTADGVEPIRVIRTREGPLSIDNRRLWAFRTANKPINTRPASISEIREALARGKFSAGRYGQLDLPPMRLGRGPS